MNLKANLARLRRSLGSDSSSARESGLAWPPGHFYSPIPDLEAIRARDAWIFGPPSRELPAIELNEQGQRELFFQLLPFHDETLFPEQPTAGRRYHFDNPNFRHGEAIILASLLRHLRPRRLIEIGSGYSSCATLDTNEVHLGNSIACTFIEPHPELLESLLRPEDRERITLVAEAVQDVDTELFTELEANDVLFIDSTHVCKTDSDVNHILFRILPVLDSGVHIHFHDIHYPFEYPREWVYQGRAWNEVYLLRAFLQYNEEFEIRFFNSFFSRFYTDLLGQHMPQFLLGGGSSLWLRRR